MMMNNHFSSFLQVDNNSDRDNPSNHSSIALEAKTFHDLSFYGYLLWQENIEGLGQPLSCWVSINPNPLSAVFGEEIIR